MRFVTPSSNSWRRFFARMFDLFLETSLLYFIAELTLGKYSSWYVEFSNSTNIHILNMIFIPFALILDALICHFCGNSLGKYLLGVHIKKTGEISLKDWLERSFWLWRSGFAFGVPLFYLWTVNRQQKLVDMQQQTTYDKKCGFEVIVSKLSKFQLVRAFIMVSGMYALMFWSHWAQQEKDVLLQKAVATPTYYWQNPVTKADALVSTEWKNTSVKNEQGQQIYTFSEINDHAVIVLGFENMSLSLNSYVDLFKKSVEENMIFNDGGRYFEKDGVQAWECLGALKSIDGSLLQIEVRKNDNNFWRIVSIQAKPYEYTNAKVEELKFQLWKTVAVNPAPLQ